MTIFPGVGLVTGAASGIGRRCAVSFAAEGCSRVALLDLDAHGLEETRRLCQETCPAVVKTLPVLCDVGSETDVSDALEKVRQEFGRVDYAVNCAGIFSITGPSHQVSAEEFDRVMRVNCRGMWLTSRAEIMCMMKQEPLSTHDGRPGNRGAIVNIASNLALVSRSDTPVYNASKAAVLSLTRSDAIDYSARNIRVNCVCPGIIDTPMTRDLPRDDPCIAIAPMKRLGTAQEVADAALFLCSSKASYIQGADLCVDGGYAIN